MSGTSPRPTTDPAEALRVLVEYAEAPRYIPPRPKHPAPGCPCDDCIARDERLEHIAEERAYTRRHGLS